MITSDPIVPDEWVTGVDPACGAVVTFLGVVRSHNGGRAVTGIFYDCYRDMAERELSRIIDEVVSGTHIHWARVVHRIGEVAVGEASLLVIVAAAHRQAAFGASEKIVDAIKARVPIWKKEHYADGAAEWL